MKFIHREVEVTKSEVSFEEFLKLDAVYMSTWEDDNGRSIDLYVDSLDDGLLERVAVIKPNPLMENLFPDNFFQRFIGNDERERLLEMEEFAFPIN